MNDESVESRVRIQKLETEIGSAEQKRILLLHQYNDIKDAAQVVIGVLASKQNVSIRELHEKYNLPLKDVWQVSDNYN